MSFADLKKNRKSLTEKLQKSLEKTQTYEDKDDGSYWKLTVDKKTGIGEAVIRFLPASEGEDLPYVQMWSHGFKSKLTGKWYIENSRTTLGKTEKDPVSEMNTELWSTGLESNKAIARDRKRKLSYYSNILVIKDKANPENEGKVFLFRYGQKIFEMIQAELKPAYDDKEPVDVFDLWEGANFRLRAKTIMVDGKPMQTYEDSEFDRPTALFKGEDEKLEKLWKSQYKLNDLVAPDKFKSYDELLAKLRTVLGAEVANYTIFGGSIANQVSGIHADNHVAEAAAIRTARAEDLPVEEDSEDVPWDDSSEKKTDDAQDYFKNIGTGLFND